MEWNFDDFKNRAKDNRLTPSEKVGFPESYRKGKELLILKDIIKKTNLATNQRVLDIGCGCSDLTDLLKRYCEANEINLFLNDSHEMLSQLNFSNTHKIKIIPGKFPDILENKPFEKNFDVILIYSVIQYVFNDGNMYSFIHNCLSILKKGGVILIGDIPNISSRDRFIKSDEGKKFIKSEQEDTNVKIIHQNHERIDDSIVLSLMQRFRNFDCETYLLPQPNNLPFGNRREDIIIKKR